MPEGLGFAVDIVVIVERTEDNSSGQKKRDKLASKMADTILSRLELPKRIEFMALLQQKNPKLASEYQALEQFLAKYHDEFQDNFSSISSDYGLIRHFKSISQEQAGAELKNHLKPVGKKVNSATARQLHKEIQSFQMPRFTHKAKERFYSEHKYPDVLMPWKSIFLLTQFGYLKIFKLRQIAMCRLGTTSKML